MIKVIGIRIAASNGEDAGTQDVLQPVRDTPLLAAIGDNSGQRRAQAELFVRSRQQQYAAIRGQATTIKGSGHLLTMYGWQREWQQSIFVHGGCGSLRRGQRLVSTPKSLSYVRRLHHIRQRIPDMQ